MKVVKKLRNITRLGHRGKARGAGPETRVGMDECNAVINLVSDVFTEHRVGPLEAYVAAKMLLDLLENDIGIRLCRLTDSEAVLTVPAELAEKLKTKPEKEPRAGLLGREDQNRMYA
jgi:hypothetical protein